MLSSTNIITCKIECVLRDAPYPRQAYQHTSGVSSNCAFSPERDQDHLHSLPLQISRSTRHCSRSPDITTGMPRSLGRFRSHQVDLPNAAINVQYEVRQRNSIKVNETVIHTDYLYATNSRRFQFGRKLQLQATHRSPSSTSHCRHPIAYHICFDC